MKHYHFYMLLGLIVTAFVVFSGVFVRLNEYLILLWAAFFALNPNFQNRVKILVLPISVSLMVIIISIIFNEVELPSRNFEMLAYLIFMLAIGSKANRIRKEYITYKYNETLSAYIFLDLLVWFGVSLVIIFNLWTETCIMSILGVFYTFIYEKIEFNPIAVTSTGLASFCAGLYLISCEYSKIYPDFLSSSSTYYVGFVHIYLMIVLMLTTLHISYMHEYLGYRYNDFTESFKEECDESLVIK